MLLRRGVDVDPRDEDGLSPLLLAVKGRYLGRTAVGVQPGAPRGVGLGRAALETAAGLPVVTQLAGQSWVGPRTSAS